MTDTPSPARPLAGTRVLDLTVALAGPFGTMMLAGLGAEVIKIEAPGGSDIARQNPPYVGPDGLNHGRPRAGETSLSILGRTRGKKSVTLDLKSAEGRRLFLELAKTADVVVENLSWGTVDRLGVGYADVARVNPGIVYASISALGGSQAHGDIKAMDIIVQALSGVMEVNGFADGPPCRIGFPLADLMSSHYAVIGIMAALTHRRQGGGGQHVQVNMLDSLVSLLAIEHFDLAEPGTVLRTGNHHERLAPFGVYAASDGYFAIAAPSDAWSARLFEVIGRPEMAADPRFATRAGRVRNAPAMNALIEGWSRGLDRAAAVQLLVDHGVAAAPVRSPAEAFADPDVLARGAVVALDRPGASQPVGTVAPGLPIRMSGCSVGYDRPAPALGADSDAVLRNILGLGADDIQALRDRGVV